jgi:riboflavin synthase
MFTGIVRELGRVAAFDGVRLRIESPLAAAQAVVGDSIAVAGVCLTVIANDDGCVLTFDTVQETRSRTTLCRLTAGDAVNIEPALCAGEPLGGHLMQGHVDGVAHVRSIDHDAEGSWVWFELPPLWLRYCVEKGSIAVDGTSLTIAALDTSGFAVALVPHTLDATTLGRLGLGDVVNFEVDVLAKYVERLVGPSTIQR